MELKRIASRFLSHFPRVRAAVLDTYRTSYHILEKARLTKPNSLLDIRVSPHEICSFFGYYDKSPWNHTDSYLLYLSTDFDDRMPNPDDSARICLVDFSDLRNMKVLGKTRAWCWQQGAMLQWMGTTDKIIFNDYEKGYYSSRIIDINADRIKSLSRPIYALSKDGTKALSLDFDRIHFSRPGYGYVSKMTSGSMNPKPRDDGIWWMDAVNGESRLIISLAQLAEYQKLDEFDGAFHYILHAEFNPSGTRFVFLHRWFYPQAERKQRTPHATRMYTADSDGSDLYLLEDSGFVSHFAWQDDDHLIATSRHGSQGFHYHLYRDKTDEVSIIGENILTGDGHPSFSPNERWLLTDTYPDKLHKRTLILFDLLRSCRIDLGKYHSPPSYSGPLRCDLHPRWSHDGKWICFDSIHEGSRGVYVIDVSSITGETI